jgi:hypothetical protein
MKNYSYVIQLLKEATAGAITFPLNVGGELFKKFTDVINLARSKFSEVELSFGSTERYKLYRDKFSNNPLEGHVLYLYPESNRGSVDLTPSVVRGFDDLTYIIEDSKVRGILEKRKRKIITERPDIGRINMVSETEASKNQPYSGLIITYDEGLRAEDITRKLQQGHILTGGTDNGLVESLRQKESGFREITEFLPDQPVYLFERTAA